MNIINRHWNAYVITNMGEDFKLFGSVIFKTLDSIIIPKIFYNGSKYLFPADQCILLEKILITDIPNDEELKQLRYYLVPYKGIDYSEYN